MKKTYRKAFVLPLFLAVCILVTGCGCGKKKEQDAQSQQVLKITITPSVAPTKAPDEMNPKAVVTNGNMTMVNEYLDQTGTREDTTAAPDNGMDSEPDNTGGGESGEDGTSGESE